MTLRLINAYTSHNLGDAAIYETLVQLAGPIGASSTRPAEELRHLRGLQGSDLPVTAHVSVGGDIFNNARPRFVTRRFLQLVQELRRHEPERTFVFGQGLPASCRGLSLAWLARALARLSSVTVRDTVSQARLRALGVPAQLGYDTVFAYRMGDGVQRAGQALMEQAGLQPDRSVLFSVREFDAMYPQDGALFEGRMAALVQALVARGHSPGVVIQAQAGGADADRAVVRRLRAVCPQLRVLDPFSLSHQGHHPLDALVGALGAAAAVVAVRYHTAILRMIHGRAPFNLYYSSKGRDLVDRLGAPGMALDDFDPSAALQGIEASMGRHWDVSLARSTVREQFSTAMSRAGVA
jgi:polysaccharide pyruvyl transferase WcaK-like protein